MSSSSVVSKEKKIANPGVETEGINAPDRSEDVDLSSQFSSRSFRAHARCLFTSSLVKECVLKKKSVTTWLPRALRIWNTSLGPYENSIRSHFYSKYEHRFLISYMLDKESVADGPPDCFTFYPFPAKKGVVPPDPGTRRKVP